MRYNAISYEKGMENFRHTLARATPADMIAARLWYPVEAHGAVENLAQQYGVSYQTAATIVAILSPQCPWVDNVPKASRALAGNYTGIDSCNKAKSQAYLSGTPREWARMVNGERRTYAIQPDAVLNSSKVWDFYRALMGDTTANCKDSHIANCWSAGRLGFARVMFEEVSKRGIELRSDVDRATIALALEHGTDVRTMQALLWIVWRRHNVSDQYDTPREFAAESD